MAFPRKSVVVGSKGQDGRCLIEYISGLGNEVIGISRDDGIDISKTDQVRAFLRFHRPDDVYFLAAYHHSSDQKAESAFDLWERSFSVHSLAAEIFLESIRVDSPRTRFFYASSSLVFGDQAGRMDEQTNLQPNSPYAITKAAGMAICEYYSGVHGVFASTGILFNHESEYRDERFLSRKIARAVAAAQAGSGGSLELGDLSARTDWGYARDYVRAMSLILGLPDPGRFVIASGAMRTVGEFVKTAYAKAGLDSADYVVENPSLLLRRIPHRFGDPRKLRDQAGWIPETTFERMVEIILRSEGVRVS